MATFFRVKNGKIKGTSKKDKINWLGQRDWQRPLTVKAGKGNDLINFAASYFNKNKLYGEAGKDKILGGSKTDYIYGGAGNDTLLGNSGNDQIHLGSGYDLADGGKGNDKIWCDSGVNAVTGGSNNDTIYGGDGYDAIDGGKGNDEISLKEGSKNYKSIELKLGKYSIKLTENLRTYVRGGSGNDKITNIYGGSLIYGDSGADTIKAISGNNTLYGGSGNDSIIGGSGNDYINGGTGADTISANNGHNTILGGAQNDYIESGYGNDSIDGGTGYDTITASGGNNTIHGGSNDDSITCGDGDDIIYGDGGNDTINAGAGNNKIYFQSGGNSDIIISGGGSDILVFNDDTTYDSIRRNSSNNDLVLKGNSGFQVTLKDYFVIEHSAKQVELGGVTYNIEDILNGINAPLSAPRRPMLNAANAIVEEVAAWSNSNNGYAVSADVLGTENTNITANIVSSYVNNQQYFG